MTILYSNAVSIYSLKYYVLKHGDDVKSIGKVPEEWERVNHCALWKFSREYCSLKTPQNKVLKLFM